MNRIRRTVSAILIFVILFLFLGVSADSFRMKTDTAQFLRVQPLSVDQWLHSEDDRSFFAAIACLDALCLFPEDAEEQDCIRGILDRALDADGIRIAGEGKTVTVCFTAESGEYFRVRYNIATKRLEYTRDVSADKELLPDGIPVRPEDVRSKLDTVLRIYE